MKLKIAVNHDGSRFWPGDVPEQMGKLGLATWHEYSRVLPGCSSGYWDTDAIPRHHPALIEALERWYDSSKDKANGYDNQYIVEVECPSGRYHVRSEYRQSDTVYTPESIPWIEVTQHEQV